MVTAAVSDGELRGRVDEIAGRLATGPRRACELTKKTVNAAALSALDGALERERTGQIELLPSGDFQEGIAAFNAKRTARFGGGPSGGQPSDDAENAPKQSYGIPGARGD